MAAKSERAGKGGYVALAVFAVVLIGAVTAAAYNQQEISNYWRLQGWNPAPVKQTVETFVKGAYSGDPAAADLVVGKANPGLCDPVIEGGRFVAIKHPGGQGPVTVRLRPLLPSGDVKSCHVRIKNRSGVWQADVEFPNGKWGAFDVERANGALRIRSVPDTLSDTEPPVQPWD